MISTAEEVIDIRRVNLKKKKDPLKREVGISAVIFDVDRFFCLFFITNSKFHAVKLDSKTNMAVCNIKIL